MINFFNKTFYRYFIFSEKYIKKRYNKLLISLIQKVWIVLVFTWFILIFNQNKSNLLFTDLIYKMFFFKIVFSR